MTRAVLPCLSHAEAKVRDVAARAAEELLAAVRAAAAAKTLDLDALLSALAACAGAGAGGDATLDACVSEVAARDETNSSVPILSRDPARVDAVAGEATRVEALRWYLALLETAPEETSARMLGVARSSGRRTETMTHLSDSLTSVFLNVSSDSDLATARATDALARLGSGSDAAFDAVVRALARALFEDEAYVSKQAEASISASLAEAPGTSPSLARERGVEKNGSEIFPERRPTFLRRRGSATIRRLCHVLGDARVVRRLAEVVAEMAAPILTRGARSERRDDDSAAADDDAVLAFASNAADALGFIALAAPECASLRRTLRGDDDAFRFQELTETETNDVKTEISCDTESKESKESKESLLRGLFPCWCHSPAATIGLCLLSGLDRTAFFCAEHVARDETELSRDALVRLDRLVYLFETPPFAGARLRLLQPSSRPHLRRALAAVLALLPQSSAFTTLRDRLAGCASVGDGAGPGDARAEVRGQGEAEKKQIDETASPFAARAFRAARAAHARARQRRAARTSSNETRSS
jgi:vacuole morphology and inheritance protein 14